ncbi:MAG: nitrilase-related carbon-nitrogen hydrolase, partial [Alphaproteobacteria bacterium]
MREQADRDEAAVWIACVQMEPIVGEKDRNVRRSIEMIEEAAGKGATLVVLPELCNSGYVFDTRQDAFALS